MLAHPHAAGPQSQNLGADAFLLHLMMLCVCVACACAGASARPPGYLGSPQRIRLRQHRHPQVVQETLWKIILQFKKMLRMNRP